MTTDPALRAHLKWEATLVQCPVCAERHQPDKALGDGGIVQHVINRHEYSAYRVLALAAAEAAPLDVERLQRIYEAHYAKWHIAIAQRDGPCIAECWTFIAAEYAALRSPDTETAGEAG